MLAQLTQESSNAGAGAAAGMFILIYLAFIVIYLVGMWKLFTKMGQPGWSGIIPILNSYIIYKLGGKEWWWVVLLFIPCINIVALWFLADCTARVFGKEIGWKILLFLLPGIGHLILAFGNAQYIGPNEKVI